MDFKELEAKLTKYYEEFKKSNKSVGGWVIVDSKTYNKLKKLNIVSILSIFQNETQGIAICETKNQYIVIKYSDRFICCRISDTEYGLSCEAYDLLAINESDFDKVEAQKLLPFREISKIIGWKLGKKAIEYLDFFDTI